MKYSVENLLRPIVEYYAAIVLIPLGLFCFAAPSLLMLTPSVSYGVGGIILARGIFRLLEGNAILSYQKGLRQLKAYKIRPQDVARNDKHNVLGLGFRWLPIHTQRYSHAADKNGQLFLAEPPLYTLLRRLEISLGNKGKKYWLVYFLRSQHFLNPAKPLPEIGGSTLLHGVEPKETTITLPLSERPGHTGVYGTTRQGKSRLCEHLVAQDIARNNGPVAVFDPKGDAGLLKRVVTEAIRHGREYYVFHLGFPDLSARYNTVGSFSRISEVATRTTVGMSGEGNSAAFKEFCWRFANIISQARVLLGTRPSYLQLKDDISNIEPLFVQYMEYYLTSNAMGNWREEVKKIQINPKFKPSKSMQDKDRYTAAITAYTIKHKLFDPIGAGLLSSIQYEKSYFDRIVAGLVPQLERLTSGRLGELLSPDYNDPTDNRPIINWMHIIRKNAVVYFGFDAMADIDTAKTSASSAFADLLSTSGYLYKFGYEHGLYGGRKGILPIINIHGDEFNEYCGCFGPLLNKAGGSGVQCTLYTQTRSDLTVGTGSEHLAGVLEGNMNTLIMMRVKGEETARLLTDQLSKTTVDQLTRVTGANDNPDITTKIHFTSKNEDRITTSAPCDLISAENVMQLPKGQAYMLTKGNELYKIRFPLLDDEQDDIQLPEHVEDMCEQMKNNYETGDEWWKFAPSPYGSQDEIEIPEFDATHFNAMNQLFDSEHAIQLEDI